VPHSAAGMDGSAGIAAESDVHDAAGYRSSRTAAGSAWCAVRRPGVARGGSGCAVGEFVGVGLTDKDHPCRVQLRDGHRIGIRHVVGPLRGAGRGPDSGGVVEILDCERNTVQRAPVIAVADLLLGDLGLFEREFRCGRGECGERRFDLLQACERRLGDLDRGHLLGADLLRDLDHGKFVQFHRGIPLRSVPGRLEADGRDRLAQARRRGLTNQRERR
jgi:hypothetical protein